MKKLTLAILLVGAGCQEDRHEENSSECGDSVLDMQEQCDDGNDIADDGCTDCRYDRSADGVASEDPRNCVDQPVKSRREHTCTGES